MGGFAGAVAEFDRLLTAQQRVLGADHPDTLTTRNNLAFCRGEGGMSPMIRLFDERQTGTGAQRHAPIRGAVGACPAIVRPSVTPPI